MARGSRHLGRWRAEGWPRWWIASTSRAREHPTALAPRRPPSLHQTSHEPTLCCCQGILSEKGSRWLREHFPQVHRTNQPRAPHAFTGPCCSQVDYITNAELLPAAPAKPPLPPDGMPPAPPLAMIAAGGGAALASTSEAALQEQLLSRGKQASASTRGNLGEASVVTSSVVEDWLKDRWAAQADMSGSPMQLPQWLTVDLGHSAVVSRVEIDFETAFARQYELKAIMDRACSVTGDAGRFALLGDHLWCVLGL